MGEHRDEGPRLSDVLYVEGLIGADTVNTTPPATLAAFRDHGSVRSSLGEDADTATDVLEALEAAGVSLDGVTDELLESAVGDALDALLASVARQRERLLGDGLATAVVRLPSELDDALGTAAEDWRRSGKVRRLWVGDASLWTGTDEAQWLGWLTAADEAADVGCITALADSIRA